MTEPAEGTIAKQGKNDYGHWFKLEGQDTFFNEGKRSKEQGNWPAGLESGQRIRFEVFKTDKGKFYVDGSDIVVLDAGPAEPSPNGRVDPYSGEMTPGTFAYKDRMILRQVCLKAAVDYWIGNDGKAKGQVAYEVDDVLVAASRFEDWALRPLVEAATEQDEEREYTGE